MDSRELEVAHLAAKAGGEVISHYYEQGVTMRYKEVADLVSDADVESEKAIVATIHKHFPDHSVLGEETHQADLLAEHLWVVDPLDGTTNFAHQIPHFAISVAYYQRGEPVCGVIFNPIRNETYWAVRGGGAFAGGAPATVSTQTKMSQALIGLGFYYDRGKMMEATLAATGDLFRQQIHGIRRFGTASLDLVSVGLGRYAAYFEYVLSPWDFAAGRLFVEEAGGQVSTCQGKPLLLEKTSVLASNTHLHANVLEIAQRHYPF